jgi:hypothetical protein
MTSQAFGVRGQSPDNHALLTRRHTMTPRAMSGPVESSRAA